MILTRSKKLFLNTVLAVVNELTIIICGFILPRIFLVSYGSAVYGLQASITQFLGIIALCELGVGAVVRSALYKPLAQKDDAQISRIICSAERFFRKLGWLLVGYTGLLLVFYPLFIRHEFGYLYTASLILIISLSSFAQYFLGLTYRILLNADQLLFIQFGLNIGALLVSTLLCIILMKSGVGIHLVKLVSSLIFIIPPVFFAVYAHKHYHINHHIEITTEPITQKWNGMAQHISTAILKTADILILTICSTLDSVAIYSVYYMVANGIKQFILSLTYGIQSTFGNMLANEETKKLTLTFGYFEWFMHTMVTFLFGLTGLLILSFIQIYTQGISDTNYYVPVFAILLTAAQAAYCLRLPYNVMMLAAGHYKQTQLGAILEAVINVVLSIALVYAYGLIGVAIGTFVAVTYRTLDLVYYLSHSILKRELTHFTKHILVDILILIGMVLCTRSFKMVDISYRAWFILACKTGIVCLLISTGINWLFYRREITQLHRRIIQKLLFVSHN